MQIDRIGLHLRRRTAWEALDLGHAMLRAWAAPAYRAWLVYFWGCGIVLIALFSLFDATGIAVLLLWWLKPVFDRILLFTFSRSLFGSPTSLRDVWRALPGLLRHTGLLPGLLWRRFSLARSFLLPVWQLEGQDGAATRARQRVLSRRARGNAVWLTIVCSNLVGVLWIGQIFALEALLPVGTEGIFHWQDWWENNLPAWKEMLVNILWMVAETLVEPFFVASGFSLYLNRRSELEGWDIELAFRRLATRHGQTAAGGSLLSALLLACTLSLGLPPSAEAGEAVTPAKRVIKEVLADPIFGKNSEETEWRLKKGDEPAEKKKPARNDGWVRALEFIGEIMRGLGWIVAGLVALLFVYLALRYRERWLPSKLARQPPPDFLFGLDVRPDSLPDDVAAAARAAFASGNVEAGLSLLYRGALVALIHRLQVEFRAGDTEDNCLQRVRGRLDGDAYAHFGELLAAWREVAYARRQPPAATLEALCLGWQRHFAAQEPTA